MLPEKHIYAVTGGKGALLPMNEAAQGVDTHTQEWQKYTAQKTTGGIHIYRTTRNKGA